MQYYLNAQFKLSSTLKLYMANCCDDPVIPPSCVKKCQQFVDACCVIDEQPLDCIFEPIAATITSAVLGQFVFTVADVTGITVGMLAVGDAVGEGAVVTNITGLVVTVTVANTKNVPNVASDPDVTFSLINNPQCDINLAINDIICLLKQAALPCYDEFNNVTLITQTYPWLVPADTVLQYSNPVSCQVRLRGFVQMTQDYPFPTNNLTTPVFSIPLATSRPLTRTHAFSVTVTVTADGVDYSTLLLPGILIITTAGVASIAITNLDPLVPSDSGCAECDPGVPVATVKRYFDGATDITFAFSIDGLTFEIFP